MDSLSTSPIQLDVPALLEAARAKRKAVQPEAAAADAAVEAVQAFGDELRSLPRVGRDPATRIQEAEEKLRQLLLRLQRAALLGDRHAMAAIAKEAAGLAKEVAGAVKDAAGSGSAEAQAVETVVGALASTGGVDSGVVAASARAMGTVRIVVATAKAAVGPRRSGGDDRGKEAALRKELDEAEREVEEAAHDIQDALQPHPSFSAWS